MRGDEAARAIYAKRVRGKHESPYSVALGDFLNPPNVKLIDVSLYHGAVNDIVQIDASDDFMVTKVTVTITDARGIVIEQGNATEHPTRVSRWEYKAVSANRTLKGTKIMAIAHDRPGNRGTVEVVL